MTERCRLYVGANEIDYSTGFIELTDDNFVNHGSVSVVSNANLSPNSTVEVRKSDGSTAIFTAKVVKIEKDLLWNVDIYSEGWELNNLHVQKLYQNTSPEAIIQDLIDNETQNLTYAGTESSGLTIEDYIGNGYLIDIIIDMLEILQWGMRIDQNGNVYPEPPGLISNGVILSEDGDGDYKCTVQKRTEDPQSVINRVKLIGGFEGRAIEETVSGTGTEFTLTYKPSGAVNAGSDAITSDIDKVESENKKVFFNTSQTDPTFFYTYNQPVVIDDQDDDSINTYGEVYKELNRKEIVTAADGRQFTQKYLQRTSEPAVYMEISLPDFIFDLSVGEKVRVKSERRSIDELLIIKKIKYIFETGITQLQLGSRREDDILDWRRGVEDRIKKLEKRSTNDGDVIFSRLIKHNLKVKLQLDITFEQNSPEDSFIPANVTAGTPDCPTLCWPRASFADEPDCSLNDNHGTWSGTGVSTGTHYNNTGWRLGGVTLASDNECAFTSQINLKGKTMVLYVDWSSLTAGTWYGLLSNASGGSTKNCIDINAQIAIPTTIPDEIRLEDDTGTSETITFSGQNITSEQLMFLEYNSDGSITIHDGDNTQIGTGTLGGDLLLQYLGSGLLGTSNFIGDIDELMIFTGTLTSAQRQRIIDKNITGSPDLRSSMVLWYSMDNPTPGDKSTTRTTVL